MAAEAPSVVDADGSQPSVVDAVAAHLVQMAPRDDVVPGDGYTGADAAGAPPESAGVNGRRPGAGRPADRPGADGEVDADGSAAPAEEQAEDLPAGEGGTGAEGAAEAEAAPAGTTDAGAGADGAVPTEADARAGLAGAAPAEADTPADDDAEDAIAARFAATAVLDVLRASGWADAGEAERLRAEANRLRELLDMVVRDHRAREASAAGVESQQAYWLVPLLRAAHGVAFGSLGAKVALRTAIQDVPEQVLASAGLRIDYGVENGADQGGEVDHDR